MRSRYPRSRSSPWNWSTRLRRWVRIRTPAVREASTNPRAATVLPAPVACSNQKRRSALGSSGASTGTSPSSSPSSCQSCGSSSSSSTSASTSSRSASSSPSAPAGGGGGGFSAAAARAAAAAPAADPLPLPLPLRWASAMSAVSVPESASTWWAESTVPSTRCGSSSESSRSSPSSSENCRRQAIEGVLLPSLDLGERRVERAATGRTRGQRVFEDLALENEPFTREQFRLALRGELGKGVESPMKFERLRLDLRAARLCDVAAPADPAKRRERRGLPRSGSPPSPTTYKKDSGSCSGGRIPVRVPCLPPVTADRGYPRSRV